MSFPEKKLIVIAGPTAVGKTTYAIQLANELKTEIISFDSRQFYKEMCIGVAVPSIKELAAAKHHFIQHLSIQDNYNAGKFERDALSKLEDLFLLHDTVIAVGGSGMYLNALLYGFDPLPSSAEVREVLQKIFQKEGLEPLLQELKMLDPDYYNIVDHKNPHRLMRALEVCRITKKTYSSQRNNVPKIRSFITEIRVLNSEREQLYQRINHRVEKMMEMGLLQEVQSLLAFKHLNALQTVGYKELFDYLEERVSLDKAVELIQQNTRRYAKRQITWFKQYESAIWVNV